MILTIGPGGCGFTFINWTISYLRGDTFYKNLNGNLIAVDIDPMQGSTAHKFQNDHLRGHDPKHSLSKNSNDSSIIYTVPQNSNEFEYILTLPGKKIIFDNQVFSRQLMMRILDIEFCNPYLTVIQDLSTTYTQEEIIEVLLDLSSKLLNYYQIPDGSFTLNYNQVFEDLDEHIVDVMNYLDIDIDPTRLGPWQEVYKIYSTRNQCYSKKLESQYAKHNTTPNKIRILKEIVQCHLG